VQLKAAKCAKIFQEKISGARSDRKQLTRLMAALAKGDVLIVTRLDRLARSTRDLLNLLGTIADKGAEFKSLRDTWADTTTAHGRLILTVLGEALWPKCPDVREYSLRSPGSSEIFRRRHRLVQL
jgi:DNA invertase Pin-like site-specific DNA recombinase